MRLLLEVDLTLNIMASYAETIDLPCHVFGDSYLGLAGFGPIIIEGVQPPNPLLRCNVTFKHFSSTFLLDTDSTAEPDQLITITDEDTWEVSVGEIATFLPSPGVWTWEADFYSLYFGEKLTLYTGTLTV